MAITFEPALHFKQGKLSMYLTVVEAKKLKQMYELNQLKADIYDEEDNPDGYQRSPDSSRIKEISEYVRGKKAGRKFSPIMPTSLLLNLRKVKPKPKLVSGKLIIDDELLPLREVDGQHRIRGLVQAVEENPKKMRGYKVPLVVTQGILKPLEAIEFVIINTKQEPVKPDLVLEVLHRLYPKSGYRDVVEKILEKELWKIPALDVIKRLKRIQDSPWYNAIRPANTRGGEYVIGERTFINSLKFILSPKSSPLYSSNGDKAADFLEKLWDAIQSRYSDAFELDNRNQYNIQKGQGISSFHRMANLCYFLEEEGIYTLKQMVEKISKKYTLDFWHKLGESRFYRGEGGFSDLATEFAEILIPSYQKRNDKISCKIRDVDAEDTIRGRGRIQLITPPWTFLRLDRDAIRDKVKKSNKPGVYVLYSIQKDKFYIGRAKENGGLEERLNLHCRKRKYDLFNCKNPMTEKDAEIAECALYHYFSLKVTDNKVHPLLEISNRCPYCGTRKRS